MIEVLGHAWLMTSQKAVGRQITMAFPSKSSVDAEHMFGKEVLRFRVDTRVHASTTPLIVAHEYHVRKRSPDSTTKTASPRTCATSSVRSATARLVTAPLTLSPSIGFDTSLDSANRQISDLKRQLAGQHGGQAEAEAKAPTTTRTERAARTTKSCICPLLQHIPSKR